MQTPQRVVNCLTLVPDWALIWGLAIVTLFFAYLILITLTSQKKEPTHASLPRRG